MCQKYIYLLSRVIQKQFQKNMETKQNKTKLPHATVLKNHNNKVHAASSRFLLAAAAALDEEVDVELLLVEEDSKDELDCCRA